MHLFRDASPRGPQYAVTFCSFCWQHTWPKLVLVSKRVLGPVFHAGHLLPPWQWERPCCQEPISELCRRNDAAHRHLHLHASQAPRASIPCRRDRQTSQLIHVNKCQTLQNPDIFPYGSEHPRCTGPKQARCRRRGPNHDQDQHIEPRHAFKASTQ